MTSPWRVSVFVLATCLLASPASKLAGQSPDDARTIAANLVGSSTEVIGSRLFYLYYFRDARRVAEILRSDVAGKFRDDAFIASSRGVAVDRKVVPVSQSTPAATPAEGMPLTFEDTMGMQETGLVLRGDPDATDPAGRVTISVVGDGAIHLYGPVKGIHRLANVIHAIDRPVGQVKIGLHTIQLELPAEEDLEQVHDLIDEHVRHARQLSIRSQELFRQAFSEMAAGPQGDSKFSCQSALFCKQFMHEMEKEWSDPSFVAKSLNSLDLIGCLYLTALAEDKVRTEIVERFMAKVRNELVQMEVEHCRSLFVASEDNDWRRGMYHGICPECNGVFDEGRIRDRALRTMTFSNLMRLLEGQRSGATLNSVQSATIGLLRGVRELEKAESKLSCLLTDQSLLDNASTRWVSQMVPVQQSAEDFLLDRYIDHQESETVALREGLRGHVATIDAQLSRMALAFEDDVNIQFYRRALRNVRRAADEWDARMGQIETTSILTNDRTPARVSPSQTVQFDLPERQILGKEILNGLEALAAEGENIAERVATRSAAASTLGPAGAILSNSLGMPAAGSQLQALVPPEQRYRVEAGSELRITPIIQPDGNSIAYRLVYPYRSVVTGPPGASQPPRIVRHFIDTEVQTTAYELREISRFRIGVQATRPVRGVPVFDKIPYAGALFRTTASKAETVQDTIILADCVIYPSILTVTGADWLNPDATPNHHDDDENSIDSVRARRIRQDVVKRARERVDAIFFAPNSDPLVSDFPSEITPASLQSEAPPEASPPLWRSAGKTR